MKKCFAAADILLPNKNKVPYEKWAVVACDQFTSEPKYWESAEKTVGDAPSALRLILPEVYLDESEARVPRINAEMKKYLSDVLVERSNEMVYIERAQSDGTVRRGLLLAVDLEAYEYTRGADSLIRATEATVIERIPPRVAVRRGAAVELPHVMLLIDDPDATVIEPLSMDKCEIAYDFDLMLGGGHIKGGFIGEGEKERLTAALEALTSESEMAKKYGKEGLSPLLFAVGDGNHSLASAKAAYEEVKEKLGDKAKDHPSRYALCEVVNIHDPALKFEPIYRVMFGVDPEDVIEKLQRYADTLSGEAGVQRVEYSYGENAVKGRITFSHPVQQLTVGTLQAFIDDYIKTHAGASVDYIHGEESVASLCDKDDTIGFIFGGMAKSELFKTVIFDGALPRKTFSMGHAEDKRYYLECRRIDLDKVNG